MLIEKYKDIAFNVISGLPLMPFIHSILHFCSCLLLQLGVRSDCLALWKVIGCIAVG